MSHHHTCSHLVPVRGKKINLISRSNILTCRYHCNMCVLTLTHNARVWYQDWLPHVHIGKGVKQLFLSLSESVPKILKNASSRSVKVFGNFIPM